MGLGYMGVGGIVDYEIFSTVIRGIIMANRNLGGGQIIPNPMYIFFATDLCRQRSTDTINALKIRAISKHTGTGISILFITTC